MRCQSFESMHRSWVGQLLSAFCSPTVVSRSVVKREMDCASVSPGGMLAHLCAGLSKVSLLPGRSLAAAAGSSSASTSVGSIPGRSRPWPDTIIVTMIDDHRRILECVRQESSNLP